jgi:hypothetical protein
MITTPSLPLKDALRGLRFGLKSGRASLQSLQTELPVPLRQIARQLDVAMETVTTDIDTVSSKLVHRILDLDGAACPEIHSISELLKHKNGDLLFAQMIYHGLTRAFALFECDNPLVSELLATRAFNAVKVNSSIASDPVDIATDLLISMRSLNAARLPQSPAEKDANLIPVALNAVFLWFLVDRNSGEDEDALLDVCCEVALALSEQIIINGADRAKTQVFLGQYASCI